jgi:hypothetical protein
MRTACHNLAHSKWALPLFSLLLGLVILGAFALGGNVDQGLGGLGVMAATGLIFLIGGQRSETLRGLRGDGRDERFALIDMKATALAGQALILAVIVGWLVEIAQGNDGNPYGLLGALAGVVYIVAVVALRVRS